jgi:hypothetical protein
MMSAVVSRDAVLGKVAGKPDAGVRQARHAFEARSSREALGYIVAQVQVTEARRGDRHPGTPICLPDVAADDAEALQRGRHEGAGVEAAVLEAEVQQRRAAGEVEEAGFELDVVEWRCIVVR